MPCEGLCPECGKNGHLLIMCVAHMIKKKDDQGKNTFLETFECEVLGKDGGYVSARGILNGGSIRSYVSDKLVKKLRIKTGKKFTSTTCIFGSTDVFTNTPFEILSH